MTNLRYARPHPLFSYWDDLQQPFMDLSPDARRAAFERRIASTTPTARALTGSPHSVSFRPESCIVGPLDLQVTVTHNESKVEGRALLEAVLKLPEVVHHTPTAAAAAWR